MTTSSAFELVQRMETDFWRMLPADNNYETIVQAFFRAAFETRRQHIKERLSIKEGFRYLSNKGIDGVSDMTLLPTRALLRDLGY
jgi:hypothetical protein